MKNAFQTGWRPLPSSLFFTAFLFLIPLGYAREFRGGLNCPAPNISITSQTANGISFSWPPVEGAIQYKTWYYRHEDHYTSKEFSTNSPQFTYASLPPGTYDFYFVTECTAGSSDIVIVVDIIM